MHLRIAILLLTLAMGAWGAPCTLGSLQDYIDLGSTGCTLGSAGDAPLIRNFATFTGITGATPISPAAVAIAPFFGGTQKGFSVIVNTAATATQLFEAFFNFQVSGPFLGATTLQLDDALAFGDGAVAGIADICRDGSFGGAIFGCSGTPTTLTTVQTDGFGIPSDTFTPAGLSSFFDVFAQLSIDGGLTGSAQVDGATLSISQVPEPGSLGLLILGGFALAGLRKLHLSHGGMK